jgi:hypothetical protein
MTGEVGVLRIEQVGAHLVGHRGGLFRDRHHRRRDAQVSQVRHEKALCHRGTDRMGVLPHRLGLASDRRPRSHRILVWGLRICSAAWRLPFMPAGLGLGDFPARRLLYPVAFPAARADIAATGAAALVVWLGMLEVRVAGVSRARRKGASVIADLDQVAERVVRLVAMGFVPMVTVVDGNRLDAHCEFATAGHCGSKRSGAGPHKEAERIFPPFGYETAPGTGCSA